MRENVGGRFLSKKKTPRGLSNIEREGSVEIPQLTPRASLDIEREDSACNRFTTLVHTAMHTGSVLLAYSGNLRHWGFQ